MYLWVNFEVSFSFILPLRPGSSYARDSRMDPLYRHQVLELDMYCRALESKDRNFYLSASRVLLALGGSNLAKSRG